MKFFVLGAFLGQTVIIKNKSIEIKNLTRSGWMNNLIPWICQSIQMKMKDEFIAVILKFAFYYL